MRLYETTPYFSRETVCRGRSGSRLGASRAEASFLVARMTMDTTMRQRYPGCASTLSGMGVWYGEIEEKGLQKI